MSSSWESVAVNGRSMDLYLSLPDGPGPFPAVVVGQHGGGVDQFIRGHGRPPGSRGLRGGGAQSISPHNRRHAGRRVQEISPPERSRRGGGCRRYRGVSSRPYCGKR